MEEIVISPSEAAEFAEFKRQKRIQEVCKKLTRAECDLSTLAGEDLAEAVIRCEKGGFGYVRVAPVHVVTAKGRLPVVCLLNMEQATSKTKAFAVKEAIKNGAAEVEVSLCPSACLSGDTAYLRRELRRCLRAAKGGLFGSRGVLKVYIPSADTGLLKRILPALSDCKFFLCGAEQVHLYRSLCPEAMLQVEVSDKTQFEQALLAGADRISSSLFAEIATSLFAEAEQSV